MIDASTPRSRLAIALATVYLVWGSSFIATKVLVTDEPPLFAAGLRMGSKHAMSGSSLGASKRWMALRYDCRPEW